MREHRTVSMLPAVLVTALACLVSAAPARCADSAAPGLSWAKTDVSLGLKRGANVLWQYHYGADEPKPHFHPLALPGGAVLTDLRPKDHPWHLAGWFSWKYINGVNYWETDKKTGKAAGQTEIAGVKVATGKDFSATFALDIRYQPWGKPTVLAEKRAVRVSPPDAAGGYHVDWTATFTAAGADVVLDRTPLPGQKGGKGYGGYAGISLRMAKETRGWTFLDSEARQYHQKMGKQAKSMHGLAARWLDYSGTTAEGEAGGVAIFDHPDNLRHPTKWYVSAGMPYFSPALIFDRPHTIPAGKSLTLTYRIVVHPGPGRKEELDKLWRRFAKGAGG